MTDQGKRRPKRSRAAACFDEITLAAFTALVLVAMATVSTLGVATAEDRLGCGLNDIINVVMAYPRGCR